MTADITVNNCDRQYMKKKKKNPNISRDKAFLFTELSKILAFIEYLCATAAVIQNKKITEQTTVVITMVYFFLQQCDKYYNRLLDEQQKSLNDKTAVGKYYG